MSEEELEITPFLKWAGGKRWFIQKYKSVFPNEYKDYYEPFIGGGAVLFSLLPQHAVISDINAEITNLYIVMRDNPLKLKDLMQKHQKKHSKDYYYYIRKECYSDCAEKAARTLYLNRTCFNGLYRVNKNKQFNVPIGTKMNCIYDVDFFETYSQILKNSIIRTEDFSVALSRAKDGDLVFADPPYVSTQNPEGFIKYNENLFTWSDQQRLLKDLVEARERGVKIVATNANFSEIKEMYVKTGFNVSEIERLSTIAGKNNKRGIVKELLIIS